MARYKDVFSAQTGWIHELARGETHPDADRLLQLGKNFDPQRLIEEGAIDFLTELREQFTEYSKVFNGYSESGKRFQDVKIYSISQTPADFMIFRNQVKLVISNAAHGVIQLSFAKHQVGSVAIDGNTKATSLNGAPQEVIAQAGPFGDVSWTYQGEKVLPEQVAKYYFTEFVRLSRNTQGTRAGRELLLEEIKTILKEKGIDL